MGAPVLGAVLNHFDVEKAHRYYGARAAYAPGGAERLAHAALQLVRRLDGRT